MTSSRILLFISDGGPSSHRFRVISRLWERKRELRFCSNKTATFFTTNKRALDPVLTFCVELTGIFSVQVSDAQVILGGGVGAVVPRHRIVAAQARTRRGFTGQNILPCAGDSGCQPACGVPVRCLHTEGLPQGSASH